TETAERMIKLVRAIHRTVVGTAPDGRPYAASDPALGTWIHVTGITSFLRAPQRSTPVPVGGEGADRYFHEMATIAERLGGEGVPRTRAAVRSYLRRMRPELGAGDQAREGGPYLPSPV